MANFGNINTIENYDKKLDETIKYLKKYLDRSSHEYKDLIKQSIGYINKVQLNENVLLLEQVCSLKERENCCYESHRKNIDIHFIVDGIENIEVQDIKDLKITHEYSEEKDAAKYSFETNGSILKLKQNDIAIFYPEDGHMTSLGYGNNEKIVKIVAKVLI